jgi:hypothetical protein
MDSTAFHELIAQVRGAAAELAQAEQKVAAFELAQQEHRAQLDSALQRSLAHVGDDSPAAGVGKLAGIRVMK